jgi:hypothetical protein
MLEFSSGSYSAECLGEAFYELPLYGVLGRSPRAGPPFARRWVAWDTGSFAPYPKATAQAGSAENERGSERMSEASGRAQMERRLVERSLQDDAFRRRLLADPKAAVEEELGTPLPEEVQVRVVEETAQTIYLVLPSSSPLGGEGSELSDRDLEAVAGGTEVGFSWDQPGQIGATYCNV